MSLNIEDFISKIINLEEENKSAAFYYFEVLLKEKRISANDAIPIIIKFAKTIEDFFGLILCFANNGDPNLYCETPKVGISHLLIYGFTVIQDNSLFSFFYAICVLLGSKTSSPAFYLMDGNNVNISMIEIASRNKVRFEVESVDTWLHNRKFNYPAYASGILEYLQDKKDKKLTSVISIFLNAPQLADPNPDLFSYYLLARNTNIDFPLTKEQKEQYTKHSSQYIECMKACFSEGFLKIYKYPISYVDFSQWLAIYRNIVKSRNSILIEEASKIFEIAISGGYSPDIYQFNELSSINMKFYRRLCQYFEKPLWKKICSSGAEIPKELRKKMIHLELPSTISSKEAEPYLIAMTTANPESFKNAILKKNLTIINSNVDSYLEFITNTISLKSFENRNVYPEDPLLFSRYSMAYYLNKEGKIELFFSDSFKNIVQQYYNPESFTKEEPIMYEIIEEIVDIESNNLLIEIAKKERVQRPYSKTRNEISELPPEFILELESRIRAHEIFGFNPAEPINLYKLLTELKQNDTPNKTESDMIKNTILQIASTYSVTEKIMYEVLTLTDYAQKLSFVGVTLSDLYAYDTLKTDGTLMTNTDYYSPDFSLIIICRIMYESFLRDPKNIDIFFTS
jgi:hypothetical protein